MMRHLIMAIISCPLISFAQKKTIDFYADANLLLRKSLNKQSDVLGGGINAGVKFSNFGFGVGAEGFKILQLDNTAVPVFLDVRYFIKKSNPSSKANAHFFSAANIGKLNYKYENTIGNINNNTSTKLTGKGFYSIESGIIISKGANQSGMLVSIALRRLNYSQVVTNKNSTSSTGTIIPTLTTTSNSTEGLTEFALKIGYHF